MKKQEHIQWINNLFILSTDLCTTYYVRKTRADKLAPRPLRVQGKKTLAFSLIKESEILGSNLVAKPRVHFGLQPLFLRPQG